MMRDVSRKRRINFIIRVGFVLAWFFLIIFFNRAGGVRIDHVAEAQSTVPFYIHAPWPAPLEWHAGGDGSYYNEPPYHVDTDKYALDFNGPSDSDDGSIVLAITDGIVLKAGDYGDGYGYQVVLGHAYCYDTRYAHLKKVLVSEGQWVPQGEPLGLVGSTGRADGSHLHFAMYYSETCESANRVSAKPEPLEGQVPIEDGMHITSRNYGVGYEAIADSHDFTGLVKHESFISTYRMLGGRFWTFGPTSTPVQVWPGTEFRYQEFLPQDLSGLPWSGLGSAMMENEGTAYFVIGPIWEMYKRAGGPNSLWGPPITHSYEWRQEDVPGYRSDFVNGSIIWLDNGQPKFLHEENASWQAEFFDRPNTFDGTSKRRFDQYLDFEWKAGESPGPVITFNGFSAKWETDVGGLISAYRLLATVQGHLKVLVDDKPVLSCNSPDEIWEGQSIELGIGPEHVEVRFWQGDGKAAIVKVTVSGLIVPPAFASEGKITSSLAVNPQIEYASFDPPPFPIPARASSTVISSDSFRVLQPGQTDEITFDVQNTGRVAWTPQGDYTLINTNGVSLGASPIQTLTAEVPPGRIARWVIPITAPSQAGVNWTEWQMAYNEEPFGAMMAGLIVVAPEGEIDFDLLALLEKWVNELEEQISAELKEFWGDLERRFTEWLQRELERQWREFWESLCGASAMVPAVLSLSAWSISRRRRGRTKHHDDRS
jgi:hypothetical protein